MGLQKEIGQPGKADRFLRLMDINGVCHIVFCGRLEDCFRGQTVVSIAYPCSVLVKPCKSRTFQPLTVHSRPPFPFTFCFLPPVNSGGTAGTVFRPVGLWGRTHRRRPHSVLAPYPGKSPPPVSRFAARPTSGTTYSRPRKKLSAGRRRCPHRQGAYSSRPHNSSTPGGSGRLPVSSVSVSCDKGNRPACTLWAAVVYMGSLSCVSPPFLPLPFSPKRLPAPFLRRVPALARSHSFGTSCPEVTSGQSVQKLASCGASPAGVFLFGRLFIFQGAAHR